MDRSLVFWHLRVLGYAAGTDCTGRGYCWIRFVVLVEEFPVRCDAVPRVWRTDGSFVDRLELKKRGDDYARAAAFLFFVWVIIPETGVGKKRKERIPVVTLRRELRRHERAVVGNFA